jgi:hypothetical protein
MSRDSVDLTQGAVLHIKGFSSRGHPAKNKYLLILGSISDSEVLGFLISSQLGYLKQDSHKKEVVRIPDRATAFLRSESIIQCFELECISIGSLCDGFERGQVTNEGRLPIRYLHKVREAVTESRLLPLIDIDRALKVLPAASSTQP